MSYCKTKKLMHILEIPSFFPPHGGLFCLEQAKALRDRGHEVRILACVSLGITVDKSFYLSARRGIWHREMEGVEVYGCYHHDLPRMVRHNCKGWLSRVTEMFDDYVMRHGRPDVLHAHCCKFAGIAAMEIAGRYGIPYYITEHLSSEQYVRYFGEGWTRHRWLRDLMIKAFQGARCVIPVARELVSDIAPFFGTDYRWHEISNIIDTRYFAYKEREPIAGRAFRYCCLAIADIHRKGYDVLAEAWRGIDDAELHIAGARTDGEALKTLFHGCCNVVFHGNLDKEQVRELLYHSDALVLPSRSEAQPLVLLEAMSTGIPVVTTECAPLTERIEGACLIARTGDADSLCAMMKDIRTVKPTVDFSNAVAALASPDAVAAQIERLFEEGGNGR